MAQNLYINVFLEAAHYASLIPLANEPTFFAMHAFSQLGGGFNMPFAVLCAIAGAALGAAFNFAIGGWLKYTYLKQEITKYVSVGQYGKAKKLFMRYGALLLFVSWMPLLNFSVVAAGFLGMRAKIALPIVLIGQIAHYGWFLFSK